MKKIRKFNLKVLYTLFALPLSFMAGLLLSGCADKNYTASFEKEEYVLSIGETVNITSDIDLENITLQDIYFDSSDSSILTVTTSSPLDSESKTEIKAHKSGKVILYAYLRGETLDSVNVTVKNQFATPTNIQVSASGLITWDKVSCNVDGQLIEPTYNVFVATDETHFNNYTTTDNFYQLQEKGRYYVCIQALGTKYIDSSEDSIMVELYYQSVREVSNFKFTNKDDGVNEKGTLTWNKVDGADYYRIIIGENISIDTTSYEFDLKPYMKNETIIVSITACSYQEGMIDSPRKEIKIQKLGLENVNISNGQISWDKNDNATSYIIHYESLTDPLINGNIATTSTSTYLDELSAGAYSVSIQALGKDNGETTFYANSAPIVLSGNLAKLSAPQFEYSITDNVVYYTITTDREDLRNYTIRFVEEATGKVIEKFVTISNETPGGAFSETGSVTLTEVGKYNVSVKTTAAGINTLEFDGKVCSKVIDSTAEKVLTVYKLPSVGTITHSYDADYNSILSFAKPAYEANYSKLTLDYAVKINGKDTQISSKNLSSLGNYFLNIGQITGEYENPENPFVYSIAIDTKLEDLDENIEFIGATSTKTLTRLTVSMMNKEGEELDTNYIYSAKNSTGYTYALYKTDSEFIQRIELADFKNDNYGSMKKPDAGYYILDVVAYSNNPNAFLNGSASDYFYVKKALEAPVLDFGKTDAKKENPADKLDMSVMSGYYLEITTVEAATNYDIMLGDNVIANVTDSDADGKVYYYFAKEHDFTNGEVNITVVARGDDDFIYVSARHAITVEKLSVVDNILQDAQTLKFTYGEGDLNFYKNTVADENRLEVSSEKIEEGTIYTVDVSTVMTDFDLAIFASKNNVKNDSYYLPSDNVTYKIHKVATITNFYFSRDKVYFTYNDTNDYLALTEGVRNEKIELTALVSLFGASNKYETYEMEIQDIISNESGSIFSFELMSLIDAMEAENAEFESLYLQRDSIKLELVVKSSHYEEAQSTYVFSSQKAISTNGTTVSYIMIEKIFKPTLAFSESKQMLMWAEEDANKFEYEVQINNEVTEQSAVYNKETKNYEFDLSSYFTFRTPIVVKMRKSADNYLDSDWSNEIAINFLDEVQALNITTDINGDSYARFTYYNANIDNSRIKIYVNAKEDIPVVSDVSYSYYEFKLDSATPSYVLNVIGYNDTDENGNIAYYVQSQSEPFILTKLPPVATTEEIVIDNSTISWKSYAEVDTPRYQVYFEKGGNVSAKIAVEDVKLSLANEKVSLLSAGTYSVSVYAVNRNFSINAGQTGYYGGTIISRGEVIKLDEVKNLTLSFDETSQKIDEEMAKTLTLSWDFDGAFNADSTVKFEVYVNDAIVPTEVPFVDGTTHYNLTIETDSISQFNNKVRVRVVSDKDVASNLTEINPYRFSAPSISISDEKVLTLSYVSTSGVVAQKYILRISIEGRVISEFAGEIATTVENPNATTIDLSSVFEGDYKGAYKIEAIIKGVSGYAVWSSNIATIQGTLLEKPTITIPKKPNSSLIIEKIKSVWGSGR